MNKKLGLFLIFAANAAFAQTQLQLQGDVQIVDDPQTEILEGSLYIQRNLSVGSVFNIPRLSFYPMSNAAILIGDDSGVLSGKWGIALGAESYVSGNGAMALGYKAKAEGNSSLAVGSNANAKAGSSLAVGGGALSQGASSLAAGANAKALGDCSAALGSGVKTEGSYAMAVGMGSSASGEASFSGGINSKSASNTSFAYGKNVSTESFLQITLGQMNEKFDDASPNAWVGTDPLFVIANGNNGVRSNALVVNKNGNATLNGTLTVLKASSALPMGEFGRPETLSSEE